jgi:hypothetical protein
MTSCEVRLSFLWRHRKSLVICVVALVLCGLVILSINLFAGWQRPIVASRVERAVRASFPGFCAASEEQVTVQPSSIPMSLIPNRYWDIRCEPGAWMTGPAMTIDVRTCSVLVPQYGIPEWHQSYGSMYENGQRLMVCP